MKIRWLIGAALTMLLGGCLMDASKLAGFTAPQAEMKMDKTTGKLWVRLGTDFQGTLHKRTTPEGETDFDLDVNSNVSPVVVAEGQRAAEAHLLELRKVEAELAARQTEAIAGIVGQVISLLPGLAGAGAKPAAGVPPPTIESSVPATPTFSGALPNVKPLTALQKSRSFVAPKPKPKSVDPGIPPGAPEQTEEVGGKDGP